MLRYVFNQDRGVADWVGRKADVSFIEVHATVGLINEEGILVGGAVLHNRSRFDLELSYYGPGTLSAGLLKLLAWMAFERAGVDRVTIKTRRGNVRMRKALPHLGCHLEGIQENLYGPGKSNDALLFRMKRKDATRWLRHSIQDAA